MEYLSSDQLTSPIASTAVWKQLLLVHGKRLYFEASNLLYVFTRVSQTTTAGGWVWEALCHNRISGGGAFSLRPMVTARGHLVRADDNTDEILISFEELRTEAFIAKSLNSQTLDHTKYYIPSAINNATFDSFLRVEERGVGLQMTLSSSTTL